MEPASCQRNLTVPGTLSRQTWWSGLEIIGTPPCSVHTAPTARRACGFETRVPAEPLCHFPKGGMPFSKAATLVGDFPGPNVALNPVSPYGGSDSKRRRKCLSLFCCERRAGIGRTSTVAREEVAAPPASASPAPAAGLASLPPETSVAGASGRGRTGAVVLAFGSKGSRFLWWTPSAGVGLPRFPPRERRQGRPSAGRVRPPRCRARGELQPRPRARRESCFADLR